MTNSATIDPEPTFIEVGEGSGRRIAVRARAGSGPGLFWLGGFNSDMRGTKALALDAWAAEHGRACIRFDYSGHGESGGAFIDGTIGRWLEEAIAVFAQFCHPGFKPLPGVPHPSFSNILRAGFSIAYERANWTL